MVGNTSTDDRSYLSRECGFNQKSIDFLSTNFYVTVRDSNNIFDMNSFKIPQFSINVPYGLVMQEYSKIKIRNSNTYHAINVKIHLVQLLDDDVTMHSMFVKVFNVYNDKQEVGTMPCAYQISDCISKESNDSMYSCLCFKNATLSLSSNFKTQAKVVKTFQRH